MNEQQKIGALEAMLFAHADPVEAARLADALRVEPEEAVRLLKKLQRKLDEEESGMAILYFDPDRWQMATRPYYGEMVKRILDTRRNAPLLPLCSGVGVAEISMRSRTDLTMVFGMMPCSLLYAS